MFRRILIALALTTAVVAAALPAPAAAKWSGNSNQVERQTTPQTATFTCTESESGTNAFAMLVHNSCGIYKINPHGEDPYIGQSSNIERRLAQHRGRFGDAVYNAETRPFPGSTKLEREIAEQRWINEQPNGIGGLQNLRNPIGPNRMGLM